MGATAEVYTVAAIGYVNGCSDGKGIEAKQREGFNNDVFVVT